jgi:hypothetical protein
MQAEIDDVAWSATGERPTAFERALVAQLSTARICDSFEQMVLLAQRVGVEPVCALLDEFGGEKIHIPTRSAFFAGLWRPFRDEAVRQALRDGEAV